MVKEKGQAVTLVVPKYGLKQDFSVEHAERLLGMGQHFNGGWQLPEDSKFAYSEKNGIRVKSGKADSAKTV